VIFNTSVYSNSVYRASLPPTNCFLSNRCSRQKVHSRFAISSSNGMQPTDSKERCKETKQGRVKKISGLGGSENFVSKRKKFAVNTLKLICLKTDVCEAANPLS